MSFSGDFKNYSPTNVGRECFHLEQPGEILIVDEKSMLDGFIRSDTFHDLEEWR